MLIEPSTEEEWLAYYNLRWKILRKPWGQPRGSEKDELENQSIHKMLYQMAGDESDEIQVIAVGRLHELSSRQGQIRYMAVADDYQKRGMGGIILSALEQSAQDRGYLSVVLESRESACEFYEKNGYTLIRPTHILYSEIQHYRMEKRL